MALTLTKTINLSGISMVNGVQVAFMNAQIGIDGTFSNSKSVQNNEVYERNAEEVLKDFAAFDAYVYKVVEETVKKKELK